MQGPQQQKQVCAREKNKQKKREVSHPYLHNLFILITSAHLHIIIIHSAHD